MQRSVQRSVQRACNERATSVQRLPQLKNRFLPFVFFERLRIVQCDIVAALLRSSWQMFVLHRELENKTPSLWRAEL